MGLEESACAGDLDLPPGSKDEGVFDLYYQSVQMKAKEDSRVRPRKKSSVTQKWRQTLSYLKAAWK